MPQTVVGLVSTDALVAEAAAVLAADIGTASTLRLYKAGSPLGPESDYADYVAAEADFAGYAPEPVTFTGPLLSEGGAAVLAGNEATFLATDAVTPNTIGGAWAEVSDGGSPAIHKIVGQYPFNVPVNINRAGAFISGNLYLTFPGLVGEFVFES